MLAIQYATLLSHDLFTLPAHGNPDGILILLFVLFVGYFALIINDLALSEST